MESKIKILGAVGSVEIVDEVVFISVINFFVYQESIVEIDGTSQTFVVQN